MLWLRRLSGGYGFGLFICCLGYVIAYCVFGKLLIYVGFGCLGVCLHLRVVLGPVLQSERVCQTLLVFGWLGSRLLVMGGWC